MRIAIPTAAVLALVLSGPALGTELTSPSFRLRSPTVASGGGDGLQSTAGSPTVGGRGVTVGEPGVGVAELVGVSTGIRLRAGFWPVVAAAAAPAPDTDGDGIPDGMDNCTLEPNGPLAGPNDQVDVDGDGIGNVCDGDFNQDDFVGGPDFDLFLGCFNAATGGGTGPADDPDCTESDMNADGFVGGPDFDLFLRVFNGPPGPSSPSP